MLNVLTSNVKSVQQNTKNAFGKWLDIIIDSSGLKKKIIAKKAGIHPGSLSRILSGEIGVAKETARALINAVNELAGREIADMETGLRLAVGLESEHQTEVQIIAERLAGGVMASGFDDLEDADLREAFFEDMQSIAESMLRRRLQEQEKRKKGNK